jgi:hypothetical protein
VPKTREKLEEMKRENLVIQMGQSAQSQPAVQPAQNPPETIRTQIVQRQPAQNNGGQFDQQQASPGAQYVQQGAQNTRDIVHEVMGKMVVDVVNKTENVYIRDDVQLGIDKRSQLVRKKLKGWSKNVMKNLYQENITENFTESVFRKKL